MPQRETFTSRFEETRGGRVPQKSKIWGDVVYGWSLKKIEYFNLAVAFVFVYTKHVATTEHGYFWSLFRSLGTTVIPQFWQPLQIGDLYFAIFPQFLEFLT